MLTEPFRAVIHAEEVAANEFNRSEGNAATWKESGFGESIKILWLISSFQFDGRSMSVSNIAFESFSLSISALREGSASSSGDSRWFWFDQRFNLVIIDGIFPAWKLILRDALGRPFCGTELFPIGVKGLDMNKFNLSAVNKNCTMYFILNIYQQIFINCIYIAQSLYWIIWKIYS